jgi:hypothetical protein
MTLSLLITSRLSFGTQRSKGTYTKSAELHKLFQKNSSHAQKKYMVLVSICHPKDITVLFICKRISSVTQLGSHLSDPASKAGPSVFQILSFQLGCVAKSLYVTETLPFVADARK